MKTTLFFGALFICFSSSSQIFITSAHFIDASDVVQIGIDTNPSITHTPSGPNQTWDYGELNDYEIDFIGFGVADWFNGYSNFPNATLGTTDADGIQIFFRKNTDAFDLIGIYGDLFGEGTNSAVGFSPYQRQLSFPSTYGTTFTNESVINLTIEDFDDADSVEVTVTTHRTSVFDAWGTITTPFGTFNAIRQYTKDSTIQSFTAYLFGFPVFNDSETVVTHNYSFYSDAQNARYILLQYTYDPNTELLSNVQWQMAAPVLNNPTDLTQNQITIYPNPASDNINILFEQPFFGDISISDASGKVVYDASLVGDNNLNLVLNNWTPGVYLLHLKSASETSVHRFIKR